MLNLSEFFKPSCLLILICVLFLLTRIYKINEVPPSVYWDEASIGYNAYSVLKTGQDEWGNFLPIHFRAFGEFKLPVYIYSAIPFINILGLNELSVRIPAVLFSLGVIILTFLLTKKITGSNFIGLWSSFFITISPWFFIFSRTGYEATAGLLFYLLGLYSFLFYKKNSWYILFSAVCFILSLYSYNSFRILIPPTILLLSVWEFRNINNFSRRIIFPSTVSLMLIFLSIIPIYRLYVYDAGASRLQAVGVKDPTIIVKNYISHFGFDFLVNGDKNLRSQQGGFGQLYLPSLILVIVGLIYVIRKPNHGILPILLLFLGVFPAAITRESPHALRAIAMVPFISMVSAMGLFVIKTKFPQKHLVELISIIVFLALFANYFYNFSTVYPIQSSESWQYGYKKIYSDFKDQFQNYDQIIISDEYAQPYIFALFYLKYDPLVFQKEVVRNSVDKWGFSAVSGFGKFIFGKTDNMDNIDNALIFSDKRLQNNTPLTSIKFLNEENAFWVYETK